MRESISEEELAALYAGGDREALEELVKRFKAGLFGFLLGLTGSADAADDIFQEVFLKFAEKPWLYKPKSPFRSWIFSVGRNAAIDYLRKVNLRREISIDGGNDDCCGNTEHSPFFVLQDKNSLRPDASFENAQLSKDISDALMSLPEEQREIFYLRHYSGLSFKEISEMLDIPIGTLLSRMSRAAASLRDVLEKAGY